MNTTFNNNTDTDNDTSDFNINNPTLAADGEGIDGFDPAADSSAPPKPPKPGIYLVQFDFAEEDAEKRFVFGSKSEPEKNQVYVRLVGKVIGCEDPSYEEKYWLNRKIGGKLGFMVGSWAVRGQKGTSHLGDLLKAYGLQQAELRVLKGAGGGVHWKDTPITDVVTEQIMSGKAVRCYLDWEFSGSTKELINPETGKAYYLQFDYKDDQLKHIPQRAAQAHNDKEGGKSHVFQFNFQAPDGSGEEVVNLYAALRVEKFLLPKRG